MPGDRAPARAGGSPGRPVAVGQRCRPVPAPCRRPDPAGYSGPRNCKRVPQRGVFTAQNASWPDTAPKSSIRGPAGGGVAPRAGRGSAAGLAAAVPQAAGHAAGFSLPAPGGVQDIVAPEGARGAGVHGAAARAENGGAPDGRQSGGLRGQRRNRRGELLEV